MKGARPTNMERAQNFGLFGMGGGQFDMRGNMKNSPMLFDNSPSIVKKKPNSLLGDFTLYRVNKEFENFWEVSTRSKVYHSHYAKSKNKSVNIER